MCVFLSFFFFKQKTAYEMRISDWSSDVCSSDLFGRMGAFFFGRKAMRRRQPCVAPTDRLCKWSNLLQLRIVRNFMRLSNLADYAVVLMSAAARQCGSVPLQAAMLAEPTGIPGTTAQKPGGGPRGARLPVGRPG